MAREDQRPRYPKPDRRKEKVKDKLALERSKTVSSNRSRDRRMANRLPSVRGANLRSINRVREDQER